MNLGTTSIYGLKLGSSASNRAYLGSTLVFGGTAEVSTGAELLVKFVDSTSGASQHRIYVDDTLTETLTAGDTEHNLTGKAWNTAYQIVIKAWDGVTESNPLTVTIHTAPDDAPTLAASDITENSANLTITQSGTQPASSGGGYLIERKLSTDAWPAAGSETIFATVAKASLTGSPLTYVYAATGMTESLTYNYRVRAYNDNPSPHADGYSAYATANVATDADETAPSVVSATVNGTSLTVVFDEAVTFGAGGSGGFAIDIADGTQNIAATYASGTDTTTVVFTLATAAVSGDVLTLQYTQPTDGWQDMSVAGNALATFTGQAVTNSTPSFILGYDPVLWLDASDAATLLDAGDAPSAADEAIKTWQDKSGNGLHFTQATEADRPVRKTAVQKGKDVVRFATGDLLLRDVISNAVAYTMFVVLKYSVTATDYSIAFLNGNGSTDGSGLITLSGSRALLFGGVSAPTDGTATTNCEVWTSRRSSNNIFLSVDGSNQSLSSATSNCNAPSTNSFVAAGTFQGDIMEVIFFDTSLATEDQAAIEAYLVDKWIP